MDMKIDKEKLLNSLRIVFSLTVMVFGFGYGVDCLSGDCTWNWQNSQSTLYLLIGLIGNGAIGLYLLINKKRSIETLLGSVNIVLFLMIVIGLIK